MKKGQYQSPDSTRPSLAGKEGFDALFEHARRDAFTPEETERLWQNVMTAGPGGGGDAGPRDPGRDGAGMDVGGFPEGGGRVRAPGRARGGRVHREAIGPARIPRRSEWGGSDSASCGGAPG